MADEPMQPDERPLPNDGPPGRATRPSKKVAVLGVALVVVVAAVAIGIRISGSSSAGAATAVRGALVSTMAKGTANLSISESIDVDGQIGTAKGVGRCNLRIDSCS